MTSAALPAEELGSGARPTPLVDAPAWLTARAEAAAEQVTLTPSDRAFLESPPTYEAGGSLIPEPILPAQPAPSARRRGLALLLFAAIGGSALLVLGLAVARYLGQAASP